MLPHVWRDDASPVVAPRIRLLTAALALAFLGVHVLSLPRSLEDIDSINFALGVESFDVVTHRPHPPGYPVFVAMAKVSTATLSWIAPDWDRNERAAVGLAIWGVLAGTAFAWVLVGFWTTLRWPPWAAWMGALLAITAPLFWFTSSRPLSDAVALVAAVAVQWALVRGWSGLPGVSADRTRGVIAAAFGAGLLIGLRTQTMWLTGPLLCVLVGQRLWKRDWSTAAWLVVAAAAGSLTWAVPLVWSTGGLDVYLAALASQGGEDFAEVQMLAMSPDARLLSDVAFQTFIAPWRVEWLGELMAVLAVVGLARLARRDPRALLVVSVAYLPYVAFTLLFQDLGTTRYALPLIVPMAGLASAALFLLPLRAAMASGIVLALAYAGIGQDSLQPYSEDVPPMFLAFREAKAEAATTADHPLVISHDSTRRVADWYQTEWPDLPTMRPREREWLRIVDHFRSGRTGRAWFMTDRRRSDVVLFDHRSRTLVKEYLHEREIRQLVGQTRPDEVRWWEIAQPAWMLGQGWALSPDVAGITSADAHEPHQTPARGYLRRSSAAHRLMLGGRYLSGAGDGVLVVEIDGRLVARWPVVQQQPWFLHWLELPAGTLDGPDAYAEMTVRVEASDPASSSPPRVGLEQFDFAGTDAVMAGFADGWYEAELSPDTGQSWRWASGRNTFEVYAGGRDARLTIAGESVLRYFDRPSTIVVRIDGLEVGRLRVGEDFLETIELPADRLGGAPSIVSVETDQVFVPAEREGSADRRQLGLRLFQVEIRER